MPKLQIGSMMVGDGSPKACPARAHSPRCCIMVAVRFADVAERRIRHRSLMENDELRCGHVHRPRNILQPATCCPCECRRGQLGNGEPICMMFSC